MLKVVADEATHEALAADLDEIVRGVRFERGLLTERIADAA